MPVVVTVMNMKGGVGKTTVAAHLGGTAAKFELGNPKPRKVLLIDYDPQFNLSQAFMPSKAYFAQEKSCKTVLSILIDDDTNLDPYHIQVPGNHNPPPLSSLIYNIYSSSSSRGTLDIVPSTLDLMYVALGKADKSIKPMEERFSKFIDEAKSTYDLVIIDCHPAGSVFTKTALSNSDHVLIPVVPQKYAVRGIGLMMKFISSAKAGVGPQPHILFNSVPRRGMLVDENKIRSDAKLTQHCLSATLKYYKAFSDPEEGRGFVWSSQKPWSGEAFLNLISVAREFMKRIEA